jgi:hypothetical protein
MSFSRVHYMYTVLLDRSYACSSTRAGLCCSERLPDIYLSVVMPPPIETRQLINHNKAPIGLLLPRNVYSDALTRLLLMRLTGR